MAKHENAYAQRLYDEPKLACRPKLLLIIPFFASLPLYPPNESIFARFIPAGAVLAHSSMVGLATCLASGLAIALISLRRQGWHGPGRGATLAAALIYVATQLACPSLLNINPNIPDSLMSTALATAWGISVAVITLAWARMWSMDFRNVAFYGALVCGMSSLVTWTLSEAPDSWTSSLMPVMAALGSIAPAFLQARDIPESHEAYPLPTAALSSRLRDLLALEWLPLLGLVICCFMMGVYELTIDDRLVKSECMGGVIAAAIVIATCLAQRKRPLVIVLERLIIPLCAAACVLLQSFPESSPVFLAGALSVYTPFILVALFALASGVLFTFSGEFPAGLIIGSMLALTSGATLLGKALSQPLAGLGINLGEWSWILACTYFVLVFGELAVFAWNNLVNTADPAGESTEEAAAAPEKEEERRQARIGSIAQEHGLTARELEMLDYVSRGYGSTYISKKLFISPSTVRTHIKHVYAKLNVNSREELITLVEGTANEQE